MTRKYKDLTSEEKKAIYQQLSNTRNMREFLAYLNVVFDLEQCTPGAVTKGAITSAMCNTVLPMINPTLKQ